MPIDVAAEVTANRPLSADYNVLTLAAPAIAAASAPGQFVMVKIGSSHDPLLRRPFSVFEVIRTADGAPIGITLLNKRIGPTTSLIYNARPGQIAACLGPLGRPFTVVDAPDEAWMVAGGVGLAPFAALAESLRAKRVTCHAVLRRAARRRAVLPRFLQGSRRRARADHRRRQRRRARARDRAARTPPRRAAVGGRRAAVMLYACGPEGMLAATASTAARFDGRVRCRSNASWDAGSAAATAASCPCWADDGKFHHVRSCLAGPVLAADQIRWG